VSSQCQQSNPDEETGALAAQCTRCVALSAFSLTSQALLAVEFPHLPYPKIAIRIERGAGENWIATEKIHGAQLVLGADSSQVKIGKRKAWLASSESFFGWQLLRPALTAAARAIHASLGSQGAVYVYGELFGGHYPHADVPPARGLVPVQTGIWYAPELRYSIFDIVHVTPDESMFVADDQIRQLAALTGLQTAPLLGRGRLTDLQRLPVRYVSRVAGELGLPPIESNFAEGYVLKPAAAAPFATRPCAKYKIPEFDEQQFDGANALDANAHLSRDELFDLSARLINAPRVASAQSKVGTNPERVRDEVVLDALIDLHDMFPRHMSGITPDDEASLVQYLHERARQHIAEGK
jgi:Rnl2 family RNA ligase